LARDIDLEERSAYIKDRQMEADRDNEDRWVDEQENMAPNEVIALQKHVMPTCRLRKVAYAVKNSSTKLLPRWRTICKERGLTEHVMPQDV
ncbi:hypothetical protein M378DRAFT_63652, partial [Amanita muscaria Koide BX008]